PDRIGGEGFVAMTPLYHAHPTAIIDQPSVIGAGTRIWHFSHICENATLGENCNLGQNVMIGPGVTIGRNVKIQNNVSVYPGTTIDDDVFLGPSCVLTNVSNPRSQVVRRTLYETTQIRRGASIGANATIVCGVTLGRYCLIGAGTVVTRDVPEYTLVVGVPGKKRGWVSRHGHPLRHPQNGIYTCPESNLRYREVEPGTLRCLDLDEDAPLPAALAAGRQPYRHFHSG
ncbi:MAG TPA: acyltransferase, partial [Opitutaceae bacterium]|nr:acyltransferase [Opitutaceae bacterium]